MRSGQERVVGGAVSMHAETQTMLGVDSMDTIIGTAPIEQHAGFVRQQINREEVLLVFTFS